MNYFIKEMKQIFRNIKFLFMCTSKSTFTIMFLLL